jgi:TolA-binding protein
VREQHKKAIPVHIKKTNPKNFAEKDSVPLGGTEINRQIGSFMRAPSIERVARIENDIQKILPDLEIEARYKLLEQWRGALQAKVHLLDPEQDNLLSVYGHLDDTDYTDAELYEDPKKRTELSFISKLNEKQKKIFSQLSKHYIEIEIEEEVGPAYHLKPAYWKWLFAPYLLKPDQVFWDQSSLENDPVIDFDAGLAVDRATLADWAFSWEQYLKRYPRSNYSKDAQERYKEYLTYLLAGLENTPTIDFETNKIDEDVEKDFNKIINKYPNSSIAKSIVLFKEKVNEKLAKNITSINTYNVAELLVKEQSSSFLSR